MTTAPKLKTVCVKRLRAQGSRLIQIWVPDVRSSSFRAQVTSPVGGSCRN
ncbi:DUF3018 family protein [Mesorhizobium sp. VK25A]|nr:antitoxin MazE-like protein [Mesorhizobium sp. VK25A]MDX8548548.1 DUF3018 family protein [Mesorhizobium sp. VK25A]